MAVIASAAGGMDIEEVAEHEPEKILRVDISPTAGLQATRRASSRSASASRVRRSGKFQKILMALYRIYSSATPRCSK